MSNTLDHELSSVTLYVSRRFVFTNRESQIYELLILRGLSNREIADALVISEKTVKNYISNMIEKTSSDSTRKMMAIGFQAIAF
ncbi:LuxR C-terminal-related transcriptional regulator [Paenibacillus abyssi]|uniref:HTH luxR-type domain-containing protein n=2 Tax=Paenibacillus abyssi TaxID=1340531 RepID=A0A917G1I7_9BACL|nr:LuxR C-terminal-related transcriptional regulator [Paenibacillus abyssi]GGG17750.1 hypothetical protein GCM10010916_38230 [Paenibacillus abyssi]